MASRIYGSHGISVFLRPLSLRLLCPTPFLRRIVSANCSSSTFCVVLHLGWVKPAHRCRKADERSGQWRQLTSGTRPREPPESPAAAGERGLRILRESSESLEQDDAMEAWRCLLRAACDDDDGTKTVPSTVYFALGNLHYLWGDLLEQGKKAELGAEGAARAVVAEVKELRRQVLRRRAAGKKKRRVRAHATSGGESRGTDSAVGKRSSSVDGGGSAGDRSTEEVRLITSKVNHKEAWEWYLKAAEKGDSRAMMQLGEIAMEAASKSAINAQVAEEWYRRSAGGDPPQPDALFQLARMYHEGIGVHPNPDLARGLYEDACEAGSSAALFFYGHRLHIGDDELGVATDCVRALSLLTRASEQGHAEAMYYLAQAYRSGSPEMGLSQDLRRFGEMVQKAAAAGSADAMFALGGVFFHGEDGFARDPRAAFRYYSAAAGQGHADASYCQGVMHYAMGDLQAAFRCYQTAAEGGNMLAWRNLASMYALGEGVARSEQMAKHILTTLGDKIERQNGRGEPTGQKKPGET